MITREEASAGTIKVVDSKERGLEVRFHLV